MMLLQWAIRQVLQELGRLATMQVHEVGLLMTHRTSNSLARETTSPTTGRAATSPPFATRRCMGAAS